MTIDEDPNKWIPVRERLPYDITIPCDTKEEHDRIVNAISNPTITIDGKTYVAEDPKVKTIHEKTGEVVIGGFKEVDDALPRV
jgi:hypothetical protein